MSLLNILQKSLSYTENEFYMQRIHLTSVKKEEVNLNDFIKMRQDVPSQCINDSIARVTVPIEFVSWHVSYPSYEPKDYTASSILENLKLESTNPNKYADPISVQEKDHKTGNTVKDQFDLTEFRVKTFGVEEAKNLIAKDGFKFRFSYTGPLRYGTDDRPLCPIGRTGLRGRMLGNW